MYMLNGWWFLSSSGSYPPVFMVVPHKFLKTYTSQESFRVLEKCTAGYIWTQGAQQTNNNSQEQQ